MTFRFLRLSQIDTFSLFVCFHGNHTFFALLTNMYISFSNSHGWKMYALVIMIPIFLIEPNYLFSLNLPIYCRYICISFHLLIFCLHQEKVYIWSSFIGIHICTFFLEVWALCIGRPPLKALYKATFISFQILFTVNIVIGCRSLSLMFKIYSKMNNSSI